MAETAEDIVHRLITHVASNGAGSDSARRAAAAACDRLYRELSRWVGADGCRALFTRALAEAQAEHPELAEIHLRARSELRIDGTDSIIAEGNEVTAKALESMLVRLVALLGRLIGDDMAMKLIERSMAASGAGVGTSDGTGEER